MIYLAEVTAYNLLTAAIETLRFCTGQGYYDTSHNFYEPRILQPALMRRDIFGDGQIGGASQTGYGELTLINPDGGLDYLANYAFDGRSLVIKVGEETAAYASFVTALKGTMQQAAMEWKQVSIRMRDRQAELNKPVQPLTYAGNNTLPNGLEGVSDIKGAAKPLLLGRCHNVAPVLVNSSRLIYHVTTGTLAELVNVFDKGAYLARGADYTSQSDMDTNAPAAGYFRTWKAGGMFRLGSSPVGQITCTAWEYSNIEGNTAAQLAYRLVTGPGGINPADTVAADYTLLDSQNAGSVGLWTSDGMTVAEALDQISASVGTWWGFDNLGRFRIARFDAPTGTAVAELTEVEILSIEQESLSVNGEAAPVWKVTLTHDINWTVQSGDSLAGVVPADRKNWLSMANRQIVLSDASVKTKHLLAQEIVYDTLLAGASVAGPEAQRRIDMLKFKTTVLTVTVRIDAALLSAIDLGVVVRVWHTRFGLSSGKLCRVIGIETDYQRNQIELRLWG